MELSSVGNHLLLIAAFLGAHFLVVSSQRNRPVRPQDPQDPQLPGVPVPPGSIPLDCGMRPIRCTYNTSLPDYNNCKKYYTCGFTNNWQDKVCTGDQNFDTITMSCQPATVAICATCSQRDCSMPRTCTNPRELRPDYKNCKKYYKCVGNTWQPDVCTSNYNFDAVTLTCRPVAVAQCAICRGASTQVPPTPAPPSQRPGPLTLFPMTPMTPTKLPSIIPPLQTAMPYNASEWGSSNDVACTFSRNGPCRQGDMVADANNCSQFLECYNNKYNERACAPGTKFSLRIGRCQIARFAICQKPCPRDECTRVEDSPCSRIGQSVPYPRLGCGFRLLCLNLLGPAKWTRAKCLEDEPYYNQQTGRCGTDSTTCLPPCVPYPTTLAPTTTTTTPLTTTTVQQDTTKPTPTFPPIKDITLELPLEEVCNSPRRYDHSSCTSSRETFIHRHPTDCSVIYICSSGFWLPSACGHNSEIWSIAEGKCVSPGSATCITIECDPAKQNTTTTSTTARSTPSSTTTIPATSSTTTSTTTTPSTTYSTPSPTTTAGETTSADVQEQTSVQSTTSESPTTSEMPSPSTVSDFITTSEAPTTSSQSPVISTSSSSVATSTSMETSTIPSSPATTSTSADYKLSSTALPIECRSEKAFGDDWLATIAMESAKGSCPKGRTGYSVRRCVWEPRVGARWEDPTYDLCVSPVYTRVLSKAERLQAPPPGGQRPHDDVLEDTIMDLAKVTTKDIRQHGEIMAGNLNASLEAVSLITQLTEEKNLNLTQQETQALFTTAGNVLSTKNKKGWSTIIEQDPSRGVTVMESVEEIGRQMAHNSGGNGLTTMTSSLAIRAEVQPKEELKTFDYTPDPPPGSTANPLGLRDRVILDKETLKHISDDLPGEMVAVWSTYYYTINELLPVQGEDFLNSRVMSLSVQGLPGGEILKPPVKLYFAALNQTVKDVETHCSFWKFEVMNRGSWSDEGCRVVSTEASGTFCECDHLTNFAILLSPSPAEGMHYEILSLISVIGCLLSILGMLVTICLYILSWKRVKSHHAAVLINLCIALIIANTTFLAGIGRTENKMVCTIVAAMLHFFYLVAFFMMFADGVQFILYVVQVFHVRRKKETFLLVLTCWIIPAVIVAITMSITRGEGYGTKDYCWLQKDTGLIAAFAVPAILVMIANFVVLCKILHTISNSKGSERTNRVKATIWNIAVMMPLLGLTWVFGLFAVNDQTIAFQYIFAVCNSLQGFFIFFFHCALNKKMRQAVVERFSTRSSQSSSMRKSAGSNKSDKKKGAEKKAKKKATKNKNCKKPVISPPKAMGRQSEYMPPYPQVSAPNNPYADEPQMQNGIHLMEPQIEDLPPPPPSLLEPQYMDLDEATTTAANLAKPSPLMGKRLEEQFPTGYRPHSNERPKKLQNGGPRSPPGEGNGSAERKRYGNNGLPRHDQGSTGYNSLERGQYNGHNQYHGMNRSPQAIQHENHHSLERAMNQRNAMQNGYNTAERRGFGYDRSPPETQYRRDRDMEQIDLNISTDEQILNSPHSAGGSGSWDPRRGPPDPQQPRKWWYGGPHTNQSFRYTMSMDDLPSIGHESSTDHHHAIPNPSIEDPYLFPTSYDDMDLQVNPLASQSRATFDPRRHSRRSPYIQRAQRLGSHSRSLDRLDHRGRLPQRYNKSAAGISTASMQRFASKEKGSGYILLEPQLYENIDFNGAVKGHESDEPVYMQIDDVTQVDSQMSLDYMAGRA